MKLTQPAARPSRWQYRMWHAVTPAAYRVAAWCYRQQVRHTSPEEWLNEQRRSETTSPYRKDYP